MKHAPAVFRALARLSLLLGLTMLPSCVIEDPPPYTQPKRTPPRLDLRTAVPVIDEVIVRSGPGKVSFNVAVASEDAGDDLVAFLLLNYGGGPDIDTRMTDQVPAGTLDDPPSKRLITIDWLIDNNLDPGCHRLTLLVTHDSNFSFDDGAKIKDSSDTARAVWWANINPSASQANMLVDCPLATVEGQ